MAVGVSGDKADLSAEIPHLNFVALFERVGQSGNTPLIIAMTVHAHLVAREQRGISAGMVAMVMGVQDRAQVHVFPRNPVQHRLAFRGVDDRGLTGIFTDNEITVVISQQGNLSYFRERDL